MAEADPRHPVRVHVSWTRRWTRSTSPSCQLTKLIGIFAAISIFIACLGLFGLAAFTTEQRTREIGTRKVLGATPWQIVGLLARRILVLVLIASVLAGVVSYFAIDEWLTGFAYRAGSIPDLRALGGGCRRRGIRYGGGAVLADRQRRSRQSLRHVIGDVMNKWIRMNRAGLTAVL